MLAHGQQQVRAGRAERMPRLLPQRGFQLFQRGKRNSVFLDESPQRWAVAFAARPATKEREMNIPSRLIPCAKSSRGYILLDTFGGHALKRKLPIVNGPGAIRGQVRDPASR